jgi:drug/metabolite transporter (DMT)-like permease
MSHRLVLPKQALPQTSALCSSNAVSPMADLGLLVLIGMISGSSFVSIKVLSTDVPPLTVAFSSLVIAVALIQLWRWNRRWSRPKPAKERTRPTPWGALASIAFLGQALPFALIAWAETRISASLTAILMAFGPIFGLFLSHFTTPDDRMTIPKVICGVSGFTGILLLSAPSELNVDNGTLLGEAAAVIASISYVFGGVTTRKLDALPTDRQTVLVMAIAAMMLFPLVCVIEQPWNIRVTASAAWALLYLGAVPTALAFFLRFVLIKRAGYVFVSFLGYLTPLSGLLLGVVFLGESVHLRAVFALFLIIGGLLVVRMQDIAELLRGAAMRRRWRARSGYPIAH